jgi:D-alanine-D-alanine ligase-like ATP-grasp enzyme
MRSVIRIRKDARGGVSFTGPPPIIFFCYAISMEKNPYHPTTQWKSLIPNIDSVLKEIDKSHILAIGITPFTRIIPAFFLKNFSIYTIKRSSDVDVMESIANMYVLEDHYPKLVNKVHGTGYLLANFAFQRFLHTRRYPVSLLFYTVTEKIVQTLKTQGTKWIGNDPATFEQVMLKGSFRELVRERGLSSLPSKLYDRKEFLAQSFEALREENEGAYVVQRADKETGGNEGTFFIHETSDFEKCISVLTKDESFTRVIVTPFIKGQSTSMLGCVMPQGTLSGPLQLQLIDVSEALHGVPANGIFFGNDIGFHEWSEDIEKQAQIVVESIGEHLRNKGYKGVFGIDFLYDKERDRIYPNECNPRFTGSLVLYSLTMLEAGVPPLEFFHLVSHLHIPMEFDFEKVNQALKTRLAYSHIAISPKDILKMSYHFLLECMNIILNLMTFHTKGQELL